ncbi:MAG: hypothetical protein RR646_00220 [Erysipelotrichaceae bacterium]
MDNLLRIINSIDHSRNVVNDRLIISELAKVSETILENEFYDYDDLVKKIKAIVDHPTPSK